jgi:hypothetical protein
VWRLEPRLFAGTGLRDGSRFGRYGIEIDSMTADFPRLVAADPDVHRQSLAEPQRAVSALDGEQFTVPARMSLIALWNAR